MKPLATALSAPFRRYAMFALCLFGAGLLWQVWQHGLARMAAKERVQQSYVLPLETRTSPLVSMSTSAQALALLPGSAGQVVGALMPPTLAVAMVQTMDWTFLGGEFAARACPLLSPYVNMNKLHSPWTSEQLSVIETAYRGKPISLRGHVPRFNSRPSRLDACAGFDFDSKRGMLMVGDRPVVL